MKIVPGKTGWLFIFKKKKIQEKLYYISEYNVIIKGKVNSLMKQD